MKNSGIGGIFYFFTYVLYAVGIILLAFETSQLAQGYTYHTKIVIGPTEVYIFIILGLAFW